jgi:hypothetical protein
MSNRRDLLALQWPPALNQINNNAPMNQINNYDLPPDNLIRVPVASSKMSCSNKEQDLAVLVPATGFSYEQEI